MSLRINLAVLSLTLSLSACLYGLGESSAVASTAAGLQGPNTVEGFTLRPCPSPKPLPDGWQCTEIIAAPEVELAQTFQPQPTCLDGEPFHVFHRFKEGQKDLVIHMQAGGSCVDKQCEGWWTAHEKAANHPPTSGIFDLSNAKNPFADYNQVRIPYCSGDAHIGHASTTLSDKTELVQHGFDNVVSTLKLLDTRYGKQLKGGQVVLSGSSAGGVGTTFNAPLMSYFFQEAGQRRVLNDSGVGFSSRASACELYDAVGMKESLALMGVTIQPNCEGDTLPPQGGTLLTSDFAPRLWSEAAKRAPTVSFAYVGSEHDETQSTLTTAGETKICAQCAFKNHASKLLRCASGEVDCDEFESESTLNYVVYAGNQHTILGSQDLYAKRDLTLRDRGETRQQTRVSDWLGMWLDGGEGSAACPSCLEVTDCSSCKPINCPCQGIPICAPEAMCPAGTPVTP